jgi:hypothetical protein
MFMAMYRSKKTPPLKSFLVRYLIVTESDEYPREVSVIAKSRTHARKVFTSNMRYDTEFKIISIT